MEIMSVFSIEYSIKISDKARHKRANDVKYKSESDV